MKVLMLGWEYAPKITGGLGVAAKGLAEQMAMEGHEVTFILPKKHISQKSEKVKLVDASTVKPDLEIWKTEKTYTETLTDMELGSMLVPYLAPEHFTTQHQRTVTHTDSAQSVETNLLQSVHLTGDYQSDLKSELYKYALICVQLAKSASPDIVHAHDWITFRAASMIKEVLGIPFVAHMHSTEHDRNGHHAQGFICEEEQHGLREASKILAVSAKLKKHISQAYEIPLMEIIVAPNASDMPEAPKQAYRVPKTIAFAGRLTHQKSPFTFLDIARELTSLGHDFKYLIFGDGYLKEDLMAQVKSSNYSDKVTFKGFLERAELLKAMDQIDLLVLPSASEPFGLIALEAILKRIPVAAAHGIGIGEFVYSLPQVERWDHYSYVKLVLKLMQDTEYRNDIINYCLKEARKLSWTGTAHITAHVYEAILKEA